jgi:uncharacterized protein YraI
MNATVALRNGPDVTYAILGTVPKGAVVAVVGRNEDNQWFQVLYPPNSQLRGWVPAGAIDVDGDIEGLVIAGPGSGPAIEVPTISGPIIEEPIVLPSPPFVDEPIETVVLFPTDTPEPEPTEEPVPTPTPRPVRTAPQPTADPAAP